MVASKDLIVIEEVKMIGRLLVSCYLLLNDSMSFPTHLIILWAVAHFHNFFKAPSFALAGESLGS